MRPSLDANPRGQQDGRLIEYVTDGKGRGIGKMVNGVLTKQWIYRDQLKPVAELDGAGNLVAEFIYGTKANTPDLVIRGGITYRVVSDQLGSPVLAINTANSTDIPFQATYAAFGERTLVAGTDDWMPFGFAGGIFDTDTKLTRFGTRDYSPVTGRWVSKEPVRFGGGTNFFVYGHSDPVNWIDPDGNFAIVVTVVAILAYDAWLNYQNATADAVQKYPPESLHNGPGDAYKHCLASCMTAKDQGSTLASLWGWANEMKGDYLANQPKDEKQMDYENNACGRSYRNEPDCTSECQRAIDMDVLNILNP